jgi:glycerophosphoryl diester phosphodiesterase
MTLERIRQDGAVGDRFSDRPEPIGFAHRGARSERRENTIDAFQRALELGATGLESDAWVTSDGTVVLDHDGVTGSVWRRRAISAQSRGDLPHHIPALLELYEECGSEFELSLDVKDPAALAGILRAAKAADAVDRLWLCHPDWRVLAGWRGPAGPARLVLSTSTRKLDGEAASAAADLVTRGIDAINLRGSQWDARRATHVHQGGLGALGWDAQTGTEIRRLIDLGLDGIYSDHVSLMMTAIRAARAG